MNNIAMYIIWLDVVYDKKLFNATFWFFWIFFKNSATSIESEVYALSETKSKYQ